MVEDNRAEITVMEKVDAQEMIDKFEEIKNGKFSSIPPARAAKMISESSDLFYENGKLWTTSYIQSPDAEKVGFTEKARTILKRISAGDTPLELENEGVASQSYTSLTRRRFAPLLDDPILYSGFVEDPKFTPDKGYVLCDVDENIGIQFDAPQIPESIVKRFQECIGAASKVVRVNPESDEYDVVHRNDPNPGKIEQYTDLGEVADELGVSPRDDEGIHQDVDKVESGEALSRGEWMDIVAALFRDEQDDLAKSIIEGEL